ncbi:uncharacterized protein LOC121739661 [Aricia agestis]|uniref:uncharacterized protein LOC121739661 n=1 Tax=Aricia agestis TaxID=91739 RepID=UPI001C204967|nr:uncharacterized protein LOC121739661 [Aricia agestis]
MASNIPVVLEGSTLGQRHQHFNGIVNKAFQQKLDLQSVLTAEEKLPIDRLYKIDLASKCRNVEYILNNLKDDDMLYVSRALKALWLLEPQYRDLINPRYLENVVFPHMIQPAVNKMRHWLQKNLKDHARCQEFYEYYKDRHGIAIKFFWHCSPDYMMTEINNIVDKLNPQDLKIICESCPQAAQVYFESLQTNKEALSRYFENEETYFKSIQSVLKAKPTAYLDIIEKYYSLSNFGQLSPEATCFIMKNHKDRFNAKLELYAGYFLNVKSVASFLSSEEAKDVVLRLARAEEIVLFNVFKKVERIIKRINVKERAAFKKLVFVEKCYGDKLKEFPYPMPSMKNVEETNIRSNFEDKKHDPREYEELDDIMFPLCGMACNFKCGMSYGAYADENMGCYIHKTPLELLFDKYRFKGFSETYQELSNKILVENSVEGRMNIFLVLVSKCGGVPEQVAKLLNLLVAKHMNEPSNLRAAVVRSLVKRACVWRLSVDTWDMMMKFGQNLGLDGNTDEPECVEGLHAVVIRHFIKNEEVTENIKETFLKNISTFKEYKLKSDEKLLIGPKLAKILLDCQPYNFLDVLADYKLNIKDITNAELTLVEKARTDKELLSKLYENNIGRRHLLKESFVLFNNEESFLNALKHNTSVLENGDSFVALMKTKRPNHDRFLTSLSLYFNEPNGLAEQHKSKLIGAIKENPLPQFARSINILSINILLSKLLQEVCVIEETKKKKELIAAFKSTTHKSRPVLRILGNDSKELEWLGAKAVANKVLICREKDREFYTKFLLQWRGTARLAIRLAVNSQFSTETFIAASKLRPIVALKMANKTYLRNKTIDPQVWEVTKQLIKSLITEKASEYLRNQLLNNDDVPENIKSQYWEILFKIFTKIDKKKPLPILCRIENCQTTANQDFIKSVMETFINEELVLSKFTDDDIAKKNRCLYVRVLAKYLVTSVSKEEQKEKLENICYHFFEKIRVIKETLKEKYQFLNLYEMLREFVRALKYNKAFLGNYSPSYTVFEIILVNMKKIFPEEKHFVLYLETYSIMLYYRSLQQSINKKPEIFKNLEANLAEATETVGLQMGQNIGLEIREITSKYFFSIIDIYKKVLVQYLDDFNYNYADNGIILPVIKGLIEIGQTQSLLLAVYIAKKRYYNIPQSTRESLVKDLKAFNDETVNFFLYANN